MFVGRRLGDAAGRRPADQPDAHQIGLTNVFNGSRSSLRAAASVLTPTGPPLNFAIIASKKLPVGRLKTEFVYSKKFQRALGDAANGYLAVAAHLRRSRAPPLQKPVGRPAA